MKPRDYDSTVARIAGNLMSGCFEFWASDSTREMTVRDAVVTARLIVAETKRTEPVAESQP